MAYISVLFLLLKIPLTFKHLPEIPLSNLTDERDPVSIDGLPSSPAEQIQCVRAQQLGALVEIVLCHGVQ